MPRRSCAFLPFTLVALIVPAALPAQLMVSRNIMPVTIADTTARGFLPRIDFYGEAQRGFGSAEDELAWDVKIGGVIELYRLSARTALVAVVGHELTANPFNSIGFNPRGAIWEETVFLMRSSSAGDWHLGAFHRCRHEIDNSHPPDESEIDPSYIPTARLLSLTGVQAGLASRSIALGSASFVQWFIRGERYATTTDNREPRNTAAPYWKRAQGAIAAGTRWRYDLRADRSLYSRAWTSVMLFSGARAVSWRSEFGGHATGRGGAIDLFVAFERTFDDVTRPTPQPSSVFGVGVRFGAQ